jgi:hypothetical protein
MPIPLIVPNDAGAFAKRLTLVSPGENLLAFGDLLTWEEYAYALEFGYWVLGMGVWSFRRA